MLTSSIVTTPITATSGENNQWYFQHEEWLEKLISNTQFIPPPKTTLNHHISKNSDLKQVFKKFPSLPFKIKLNKLSLSTPQCISDAYLKSNNHLSLQFRFSFFDLESNQFFGKTWKSKKNINLRENLNVTTNPTKSTNDKDSDYETSDSESAKSPKKPLKSNDKSKNNNSNTKKKFHIESRHIDADLSDIETDLFFHTSSISPNVVIVVEYIIVVRKHRNPESQNLDKVYEELSAGWSILSLFNPQLNGNFPKDFFQNGLDPKSINSQIQEKLSVIYPGTPRALLFTSQWIMDGVTTHPALKPLAKTSLQYTIRPFMETRNVIQYIRENQFFSKFDELPGFNINNNLITSIKRISPLAVSDIKIEVTPSTSKVETYLLEKVDEEFYKCNPHLKPDSDKDFSKILERRLLVGIHNTNNFLQPPQVTVLQKMDNNLGFSGSIKLDPFIENEKDIAIIFGFEYKVLIAVKEYVEEKTGFTAMIENLVSPIQKEPVEKTGIEKCFLVGWGLIPSKNIKTDHLLELQNRNELHPFNSPIFHYNLDDMQERFQGSVDNLSKLLKDTLFTLSFTLSDSNQIVFRDDNSKAIQARSMNTMAVETHDVALSPFTSLTNLYAKPPNPRDYEDDEEENSYASSVEETDMEPVQTIYQNPTYPKPFMNTNSNHPKRTRYEKARLLSANFSPLVDISKNLITLTDESRKLNLLNELNDQLKVNDIIIRISALTLYENDDNFAQFTKNVFFTYQFYNFPTMTTQKYQVYTGPLPYNLNQFNNSNIKNDEGRYRSQSVPNRHYRDWSHQSNQSRRSFITPQEINNGDINWPGILYKSDDNNELKLTEMPQPGCTNSFSIDLMDDSIIKNQSKLPNFLKYLSKNYLYIDVWDSDSLLHLGYVTINLKPLLRQGEKCVLFESDAEIVVNEFNDDSTIPKSTSDASLNLLPLSTKETKSNEIKRGKLHFSIANVGTKSKLGTELPTNKNITIFDFNNNLTNNNNSETKPVIAQKLSDISPELKEILKTSQDDRENYKNNLNNEIDQAIESKRKHDTFRKIIQKENHPEFSEKMDNITEEIKNYQQTREERQRDLQTVQLFRERYKNQFVRENLENYLTTKYEIEVNYGESNFFEFIFINPYSTEHTFEINFDDNDLRVIKDVQEWKYFRKINNIHVGVEESIFNLNGMNNSCQFYLKPHENMAIPFIFQSYPDDKNLLEEQNLIIQPRDIKISILNSNRAPICFLNLIIKPKPLYIDRQFRFFKPENELLRKIIRFIPGENDFDLNEFKNNNCNYVLCSDRNAIVRLNESINGPRNTKDLQFKCKTALSPDTRIIYFMFYNDQYHAQLSETWKIIIHSLKRVDINCIIGQTNRSSIVIKGGNFTRPTHCYLNNIEEVLINPPNSFHLTANVLNEIEVFIRPRDLLTKDYIMNVVDTEYKKLLNHYILITHSTIPNISKKFELVVPLFKAVNKRILYTNPYQNRKSFYLYTDKMEFLQFKEPILEVEPGQSKYLGLRFTPQQMPITTDLFVFINDEVDQTEECLQIKVIFQ